MKALVISGGGVKGAFAVGVLKGLQQKFISDNSSPTAASDFVSQYKIISGTSTGALIAPLFATGQLAELERLYTDAQSLKDYYKMKSDGNFGDIFTWEKSIFNVDGLKIQLQKQLSPIYNDLMKDEAPTLFFAAVSMNSGELVYFCNKDLQSKDEQSYRIQKIDSFDELISAIMASANQPVFAPLVSILNKRKNKKEEYSDGGVREYLPLQGVIDHEATNIDIIENSPLFFEWQTPPVNKDLALLDILVRTIDLLTGEVGFSDIQYAKRLIDTKNDPTIQMQLFRPSLGGYGKNHDKDFPFKDNNLDFDSEKMIMMLEKGMEVVNNPTSETYEFYSKNPLNV